MNQTFPSNFDELHQKGQSKLNYKLKYSNTQWLNPPNVLHERYLASLMQIKIKRRNYNCDESNSVQLTKCLDEFYMKKLNCSFPWLQTEFLNLQKCWKNHYIDDLKKLLKNVSKIYGKHSEEVEQCLTPNCVTTKWKTVKHEKFTGYGEEFMVNLIIDSSLVK